METFRPQQREPIYNKPASSEPSEITIANNPSDESLKKAEQLFEKKQPSSPQGYTLDSGSIPDLPMRSEIPHHLRDIQETLDSMRKIDEQRFPQTKFIPDQIGLPPLDDMGPFSLDAEPTDSVADMIDELLDAPEAHQPNKEYTPTAFDDTVPLDQQNPYKKAA